MLLQGGTLANMSPTLQDSESQVLRVGFIERVACGGVCECGLRLLLVGFIHQVAFARQMVSSVQLNLGQGHDTDLHPNWMDQAHWQVWYSPVHRDHTLPRMKQRREDPNDTAPRLSEDEALDHYRGCHHHWWCSVSGQHLVGMTVM